MAIGEGGESEIIIGTGKGWRGRGGRRGRERKKERARLFVRERERWEERKYLFKRAENKSQQNIFFQSISPTCRFRKTKVWKDYSLVFLISKHELI